MHGAAIAGRGTRPGRVMTAAGPARDTAIGESAVTTATCQGRTCSFYSPGCQERFAGLYAATLSAWRRPAQWRRT